MARKYDIDFFIAKFTAIPASKWTIGVLEDDQGRKCALGHCGARMPNQVIGYGADFRHTAQSKALRRIIPLVECFNDDANNSTGTGKTPRTRVLNVLREIKRKQSKGSK